jgi:predicted phage terminase large subunit-like protein
LRLRWAAWNPAQRLEFLGKLDAQQRERLLQIVQPPRHVPQWATAGTLAKAIDPNTIQTPALDVVDEALTWLHESPGARLLVSMPPQEGKSERVTKTGALLALTRNPDTRVGIVSYGQSLAEMFSRDIRNRIITNSGDEGTLDLGLRIAGDNGSARRWQLDGHRGGVVAVGIGSSLTGRPVDLLIIDDPIADSKQADSEYFRNRVWDWWQSVGIPRLGTDAPVCVVLTRWHEDDIAGRLLKGDDAARWNVINIPALSDHRPEEGESDPLGRPPGQWLDSARRRTTVNWEEIRISVGSRTFHALYQGRPAPAQGAVWKRQWWRRYHAPLWSQHPDVPQAWLLNDVDQVLISVDCAFKDTDSSDFVVMQVWARRGAQAFLVDQVRKRLSFTETVTALVALVAKWPQARAKLVEDKANGTAVISTLKKKVPGLIAINPTDSKFGRATAVSPYIESGNVLLPDPEIGLFDPAELIDEAASFPTGAHDDQVDATSQALAEMLMDGTGFEAWLGYIRRMAEKAAAERGDTAPPDPKPRLSLEARLEIARTAAAGQGQQLHKCDKPDCFRLVSLASKFCCRPCAEAAAGQYEIEAHTAQCDQWAAERGAPDGPQGEAEQPAEAEPEQPLTDAQKRKKMRDEQFRAMTR